MRWIRRMAIMFQSAPNTILCLLFLIRDYYYFENKDNEYKSAHHYTYVMIIVLLSLGTSLYSIIIRLVIDDSYTVDLYANNYKHFGYYQRLLFRIFEVSLRMTTLTMLWISCGGFILTLFVVIEIMIILIIQCKDKTNDNKDLLYNYFWMINLSGFAYSKSKNINKTSNTKCNNIYIVSYCDIIEFIIIYMS